MKKYIVQIELAFKIVWIFALLFSLYGFGWVVFLSFVSQDIFNVDSNKLTWMNFIVPNAISVILLLVYSKELIMGYNQKSNSKSIKSLIVLSGCILYIGTTQLNFYIWIIEDSTEDWFVVIPIIMIVTSMVGLFIHRITNSELSNPK